MALWISGTIWMGLVATQNFFTIERVMNAKANPAFNAVVEKLGSAQAHDFLHYLAAESNRLFFQIWGFFQIGLGIFTLWLVVPLPRSSRPKWMIVSMLGISLLFSSVITPKIVSVGRELDFIGSDMALSTHRTFGLLDTAYTVLDSIKLILGILVTLWLIRQSVQEPIIAIRRS
jgi:hypothetical protein